MPVQVRAVSIHIRRWRSAWERGRILRSFEQWKAIQHQLAPPRPLDKRLLIIRLDDIGDYLLFRNQLAMYKKSARFRQHAITLLGNESWKELFDAFDHKAVDDTLWVNKARYLTSAPYRLDVWKRLRSRGYETVVAPARTRPLLLDDLCMLAAAPVAAMGSVNTYVHAAWNRASDRLYRSLLTPPHPRAHEFRFNGQFSAWVCGVRYGGMRPALPLPAAVAPPDAQVSPDARAPAEPYLLCFVGANTRSRRWPLKRWVQFIRLFQSREAQGVVLAGGSPAEVALAAAIQAQTGAISIAGSVSLLELLDWVARADAVVTNDTMAAHLGVSCDRPTLIVANGVNYQRFTDYEEAGIARVATMYPAVFNRKRKRLGDFELPYTDALTADIASIKATAVYECLRQLRLDTSSSAPADEDLVVHAPHLAEG